MVPPSDRTILRLVPFILLGNILCANNDTYNNEKPVNSSAFTSSAKKPPYTLQGGPYHAQGPRGMQGVYHCGRTINDSRGFIHTPGFPDRFPVPIICRWVLRTPPGKKIVLYLTQFYMRDSFQLTEYDAYTDERTHRGRHELGTVSFEDEVTSVTVYRPWLVLKFQVTDTGNIHLRVGDFLMDVHGFNITYEIVDINTDLRTNACSVYKCSFLGNCWAENDFSEYKCHCFPGFFGEECQYGPFCNPQNDVNMCRNGGKCRYFYGSLVNTCECPPTHFGVQCEKQRQASSHSERCQLLGCSQTCENTTCTCEPDFKILADNKTCVERDRVRFYMNVSCKPRETLSADPELCEGFNEKITKAVSSYLPQTPEEIKVIQRRIQNGSIIINLQFVGENLNHHYVKDLMERFVRQTNNGTVCKCSLNPNSLELQSEPALHGVRLYTHEDDPIVEGHLLTLACKAKGPPSLRFAWRKDGAVVRTDRTSRNMWETRIPSDDGVTQLSILDIDRAQTYDEGTFSCEVYGRNETRSTSLKVSLIKRPWPSMKPLAASVLYGTHLVCTCLARYHDPQLRYRWFRNGVELKDPGENEEVIEDVLPTGSRLHVRGARRSEVYTCEINGQAGHVFEACHVTVAHALTEANTCPEELHRGIRWSQTYNGTMDVQPCPNDKEIGKTYRKCLCTELKCSWQEPNYAECAGDSLRNLDKNMKKLSGGYESVTPTQVYQWLLLLLQQQNGDRPFLGDLELAAKILSDLHRYEVTHLTGGTVGLQNITFLTSFLLDRSLLATPDELKKTIVWYYLVELSYTLYNDWPSFCNLSAPLKILTKKLDLQITTLKEDTDSRLEVLYDSHDVVIKVHPPSYAERRKRNSRINNTARELSFVAARYRDLRFLMRPTKVQSTQFRTGSVKIDSDVFTIGHIKSSPLDEKKYRVTVDVFHNKKIADKGTNETICLSYHKGSSPLSGDWREENCVVLRNSPDKTQCQCSTPVQFVIGYIQDERQAGIPKRERSDSIFVIICCSLSVVGCLSAVVLCIIFWRKSKGVFQIIAVNICASLILMDTTLILFFTLEHTRVMCDVTFFLLAFTLLLTLMLVSAEMFCVVFSLLWDRTLPNVFKILLPCWGIPFVIETLSFIARRGLRGDTLPFICFVDFKSWEFFVLSLVTGTMALMNIFLLVISVREMFSRSGIAAKLVDYRRIAVYQSRSVLLLMLLCSVLVLICVVGENNSGSTVYETMLGINVVIVGLVLLLMYGISGIKVLKRSKGNPDRVSQTSLIGRAKKFSSGFLSGKESTQSSLKQKPRDEDKASDTEENTEVQPRYTKEQREYLLALLGTSKLRNDNTENSDFGDEVARTEPKERFTGPRTHSSSDAKKQPPKPRSTSSRSGISRQLKPERGRSYISDTSDTSVSTPAES